MSWEVALAAFSTGFGIVSDISQAQQQSQLADYNAQVAEAQATAQRQSAAYEASQYRDRARRLIATQRAEAAASGFGLEGSPFEVMNETAAQAAYDELLIKHQGSVAAAQSLSQASMDRLQSGAYSSGGYYGAGTTFLTGASDIAKTYGKTKSGS